MIAQLLAVIINSRQAFDEGTQSRDAVAQLLVPQVGMAQQPPVRLDIVVSRRAMRQNAGGEETIDRKFLHQLHGVAGIVQDRQHKRVALAIHLLLNDGIRQFARGLDVAVDIVFFVALPMQAFQSESSGNRKNGSSAIGSSSIRDGDKAFRSASAINTHKQVARMAPRVLVHLEGELRKIRGHPLRSPKSIMGSATSPARA